MRTRGSAGDSPLLLLVAGLFVAVLVTSNIIVTKLVQLGPFTVPAAIVLFPLAYLFGDVLTEVWGFAVARLVIWTGFTANAVVAGFIALAVALPAATPGRDSAAFTQVLSHTPRVVAASLLAYLAGEFLNSAVLARLKVATAGRYLWMRTIGSTLVGQSVDSTVFIVAAFAGVLPWPVIGTVIRDLVIVKVAYEVLATPLTYAIVTWLKHVEGVDVYDRHTSLSPLPTTLWRNLSGSRSRPT
ncbi:MAG: queuosine precursor transporter [Candidatus Dormibacteria bacterium]